MLCSSSLLVPANASRAPGDFQKLLEDELPAGRDWMGPESSALRVKNATHLLTVPLSAVSPWSLPTQVCWLSHSWAK